MTDPSHQNVNVTISDGFCQFDLDVFASRGRCRNWFSVQAHSFQVKLNGLADQSHRFATCLAGRDTTQQIGNVSAISGLGLLNQDGVSQWFSFHNSPACRKMLRSVFLSKSNDGFPATVTVPGLLG